MSSHKGLSAQQLATGALYAGLIYLGYRFAAWHRRKSPLDAFPSAPSFPLLGAIPYIKDFNKDCLEMSKTLGPIFRVKFGLADEFLMLCDATAADKVLEHDSALSLRTRLPFFKEELRLHDEWLPLQDTDAHVIAQRRAISAGARSISVFQSGSGVERSCAALLAALKHCEGQSLTSKQLIHTFQESFTLLGISISYGLHWSIDDVRNNPTAAAMVHAITEYLSMLDMTAEPSFAFPFLEKLLPWRTSRIRKGAAKIRTRAIEARLDLYRLAMREVEIGGVDSLEPSTLKSILSNDDSTSALCENDRIMSLSNAFAGSVDTSSHQLSTMMACLASYPEWQYKLREEVEQHWQGADPPPRDCVDKVRLARAIVKETMRLYGIFGTIPRINDKAFAIDGRLVPANSIIFYFAYAVNRDTALYGEDALDFNPQRWIDTPPKFHVYGHGSFGVGRRSCPGSALAETLLTASICQIVWQFDIAFAEKGPMGAEAMQEPEYNGVLELRKHRPIVVKSRM